MIVKLRQTYPLAVLLCVAQIARSTYYYHAKRHGMVDKYSSAKEEIQAIYHENKGWYGYRRITMELRERGFGLNHKTVQRLMKELGLMCCVRPKKYKSYKGAVGRIAPDLLERDFEAQKPNQKWGDGCHRIPTVRAKAVLVTNIGFAQ